MTLVLLLHHDLHDDHMISALHHIVSSVIRVTSLDSEKPGAKTFDGQCEVLHKRTTGKVLRTVSPRNLDSQEVNYPCYVVIETVV